MVSKIDNMTLPPDLSQVSSEEIIRVHISRFAQRLEQPEEYPVAAELNEFFPLVHKALISKQRTEKIDDDKMVLFVEDDPPEEINTETITFYLQSRSPGQWSQGPAGAGGTKEVRHHIRDIKDHPEHPNEKLVTLGKFYDNYIRFNIYAKTNKQARTRLLWFTQMMGSYLWYFALYNYRVIEQGVGDRKRVDMEDGTKTTRYPVVYYVRTEDVYHTGTQEMKQVALMVDVDTS
jgi:hypothetical protein